MGFFVLGSFEDNNRALAFLLHRHRVRRATPPLPFDDDVGQLGIPDPLDMPETGEHGCLSFRSQKREVAHAKSYTFAL